MPLRANAKYINTLTQFYSTFRDMEQEQISFKKILGNLLAKQNSPVKLSGTKKEYFFTIDYMYLRVAFTLFLCFAAARFFLVTLGDSKCCLRRASEIIDSCCTRLLKRLRNDSKLSPSLILTSTNFTNPKNANVFCFCPNHLRS